MKERPEKAGRFLDAVINYKNKIGFDTENPSWKVAKHYWLCYTDFIENTRKNLTIRRKLQ